MCNSMEIVTPSMFHMYDIALQIGACTRLKYYNCTQFVSYSKFQCI